ncbi:hypothetical protein [Zunongwangia atlantica]|uniref:Uncharacterized protein n=1 Tax=Zunongwangia atlantica 22II14-10F7 TaxID=1185767 RepID=A0A1Y1SZG6_9FLAO|nr:hypothetical protein [Zunongwangia atlantica]ORL43804.1 hypothetical protein IIF7_19169 [Zunongwangia atlantica 22II14-10F7]
MATLEKDSKEKQSKQDLKDLQSHKQMVDEIIYLLRAINAELLPSNFSHARTKGGRKFIERAFSHLETNVEARNYLQTFGPFVRLYKYLKERYQTEVLDKIESENN